MAKERAKQAAVVAMVTGSWLVVVVVERRSVEGSMNTSELDATRKPGNVLKVLYQMDMQLQIELYYFNHSKIFD